MIQHQAILANVPPAGPGSGAGRPRPGCLGKISEWVAKHLVLAVLLVSLLAVTINCYPVIFCGRSFVSPACTGPLVYTWWPPLPGQNPGPAISQHGSDTGATMVWGVPAGFIASRSLLQHGELPLWDRYGHGGSAFIGQAISMLGDPLQLIVVFGHGSAGAWDIKFLTAKFLFCAGFGLLILRLFGSGAISLLYAMLAAYCGAFFYIDNHLVFFPFAYSPWVLLACMAMLDLRGTRAVWWGLVWLVANVACFCGGHVEVGVVLIAGFNLAGLAFALTNARAVAGAVAVLVRIGAGTLLFIGLTAPVWLSFLAALPGSYSIHQAVKVYQMPINCLPGLLDDLFYQLMQPKDALAAIAPGASLLVVAGCVLSLWYWRQFKRVPFFWVNTGAILLWGGCLYGAVPAALLEQVPMLNRVGHNFVDFSYMLILHLTIQSAFGFKGLAAERDFRKGAFGVVVVGLVLAAVMLEFCLANKHRPVVWSYFLAAALGAVGAPMLYVYLKRQGRLISVIGWTGIIVLGFLPQFRFAFYHGGNEDLLMIPGPREVLDAPSAALDRIKADQSGPFRVVGLDSNLLGDYAAVYGLEDIRSCAPLTSGGLFTLIYYHAGIRVDYGWTIKVIDPVAAQPLLNILNVKYLLAPPGVTVQPGLDFKVADRSDFGVLENLEVWPRAFFTDGLVSVASLGELLNHLQANRKTPFVAVYPPEIEQQPALKALCARTNATVQAAGNYVLRQNSTAFDVHATGAGVVCLTEAQAPDFTATANGEPKAVLTVNHAFKGVYLDHAGDYHLEFTYRPRHWRLACLLFWLAAAGVVVLAALGLWWNPRRARSEPAS